MIGKLPHLILLCMTPFLLVANNINERLTKLEEQCNLAKTQEEQLSSKLKLANYLRWVEDNEDAADSVYWAAIKEAEFTLNDDLMFTAYKAYVDNIPDQYEHEECSVTCDDLIELAERHPKEGRMFQAYLSNGHACLKLVGCEDGEHYGFMALEEARSNNDLQQKIRARLLFGAAMVQKDNFKVEEAFRQYIRAELLMEELSKEEKNLKPYYQSLLNDHLFKLFRKLGDPEGAIEQKQLQIQYLESVEPVDSVNLLERQLELYSVQANRDSELPLAPNFDQILEFTVRTGNIRLRNLTLSKYREWLINAHKFEELRDLMLGRFKDAFKEEWGSNTVMAHIYEAEGKFDSCVFLFKKELGSIKQESENYYWIAHVYKRFGEYYLRRNKLNDAKKMFLQSVYYASSANRGKDHLLPVSNYLTEIARAQNDFENAFTYNSIYDSLRINRYEILLENNLKELSIQKEEQIKKRVEELEAQEKKKKHQSQYFWIVIIIILGILGLVAVSSLAVPEWLIEMLAFFSILSIFEFFVLLLDGPIKSFTEEEPIKVFAVKLFMFSILFPLHHIIENTVTAYLKKNKLLINKRGFTFKKLITALWPWLRGSSGSANHA